VDVPLLQQPVRVDPEALMGVYPFEGKEPQVAADAFVAPTATLIGDVVLEAESSVWFGAVLRGDFDRIVVGPGSCVQDNVVVHAAEGLPTIVGTGVTVGHAAMLEGCVVEDGALIAMGAIVLQGARVGAGALVAAGSVVREGFEIPPRMLAAGVPAVVKKEVDGSSRRWVETAAAEYRELRRRYLAELTVREESGW
jgi:carbonic anhydrase/acetyltransferase-like protein (isoleucine patch superfamily)